MGQVMLPPGMSLGDYERWRQSPEGRAYDARLREQMQKFGPNSSITHRPPIGPNATPMGAGPDRPVLADLLEQFPGITPSEANMLLQKAEEARKVDGRRRYMEAMQAIASQAGVPPTQEAATYGTDGKLIRGVEQPGAPPPPTPTQPPRMQPPRPMPGMAQPIQPPQPGTQYGQPVNTTPPGNRHGGDMDRRLFAPPAGNNGFGSRMGDAPDDRRSADFVDSDGDGIDDRYQSGPGMPRAPLRRPPYAAGPHHLPPRAQ